MLIPRKIPPDFLFKEVRKLEKSQRKSDIDVVLSAFRSWRSIQPVGYLSTPITTGILFYEVLAKHQVKTLEELLAINSNLLFEEIIAPNINRGIALGDELAMRFNIPIIVPAVFEARSQRWTQDDYMYVWYQVIKEMVGHTILSDFWEYSNGGVEEFVHSAEMQFRLLSVPLTGGDFFPYVPVDLFPDRFVGQKIEFPEETMKITDERGLAVRIEEGAMKISEAVVNLYRRGFRAVKLLVLLKQLVDIAHCVNWHWQTKQYRDYGLTPHYLINKKLVDRYWQIALAAAGENRPELGL